jgi:hypothetical protein
MTNFVASRFYVTACTGMTDWYLTYQAPHLECEIAALMCPAHLLATWDIANPSHKPFRTHKYSYPLSSDSFAPS